jgi:hypothetical protein
MGGREICATEMPDLVKISAGRASRCHFTDEVPAFAERLRAQMEIASDTEVTSR